MVKAAINGERVECGKCGALLMTCRDIKDPSTMKILGEDISLKNINVGKKCLQIKCKHKANGKTCNEINEILL
jgi:hypothetical protein